MRLFIAVPLPPEIRAGLASLQGGLPNVRWTEPENMHITLRFVGETDGGGGRDLDAELASVQFAPFELSMTGIGCFQKKRKVHTLWAGVESSPELSALQERVERATIRAGFDPEGRKFKPHVTLARFRHGAGAQVGGFMEVHNAYRSPPFTVDHITLFESHLSNDGPRYVSLTEYTATLPEAN